MADDPKQFSIASYFKLPLLILAGVVSLLLVLDRLYPPPIGDDLDYSRLIVDADGEHLRRYTTVDGYWRFPVNSDTVDATYLDLLLAYEDKRFYMHPGVDPVALMRAAWQLATHGRVVSGGSTLTMQLARLLEPRPRTFTSKFLEIARALQLELRLNKQQILSRYLELAPYGGNLQGLRAATLFYFDKEPGFLTLAESALLIALPQSPESRRPDRHSKSAKAARDAVMQRLVTQGYLASEEALRASSASLPGKRLATPQLAPHLADRLRREHPGELVIETTLDAELQLRVEALLDHIQAKQPAGVTLAALVVNNETREMVVNAGSSDYFATTFSGQVDMVSAIRSPGSTLKPFIYGLGFDTDILHPETRIIDTPGGVSGYAPGNFDRRYLGEMSVAEALIKSRNTPAVQVLQRVGPSQLTDRFAQAGVELVLPKSEIRPTLAIALGGAGIRLHDLVALYTALANEGLYTSLVSHSLQSGQFETRLLSSTASWYLTNILADAIRPPGYQQTLRKVAFKTGTAYGYRDAWAVGYNASHTVGIWLGRPDGGYTQKLYGLQDAVPVMLDLFAMLPDTGLGPLLQKRPKDVVTVSYMNLPARLQQFEPNRYNRVKFRLSGAVSPAIHFPLDRSEIVLNQLNQVLVEGQGGQPPYHWFENGRLLEHVTDTPKLKWTPAARGEVILSLLDSQGASDRIMVNIKQQFVDPPD